MVAKRLVVAALAALFSACANQAQPNADGALLVVATTSIVGDIARNVVGEERTVEVLIPIGVDAHDFAPSAQQASLIAGADLVVATGLGLEQRLEDVLASAAADGVPVVELGPMVDPIPFSDGNGEVDPHFWMDPIRVGTAARALAAELGERVPGGAWEENAAAYADEMAEADIEISRLLDQVPEGSRKMVTNHEAFGYFANRYGFEIIGVVIPGGSTLAEPSSAELTALVETMRTEGVSVIFAETSLPTRLAEAIAADVGEEVHLVELFTESLGPSGSGADTLVTMLVTNAERVASSLG